MKSNKNITLIGIVTFILLSVSSCDKNELRNPILPPETQTGENKLGCCIEGKRFIGPHIPRFWIANLEPLLKVEYDIGLDYLTIKAYGIFEDKSEGSLYLKLINPKVGTPLKINKSIFTYYLEKTKSIFSAENSGELIITKMDTVNKIVSGQFRVVCKNTYNTDSIRIGNGRFDLTYEKIQ